MLTGANAAVVWTECRNQPTGQVPAVERAVLLLLNGPVAPVTPCCYFSNPVVDVQAVCQLKYKLHFPLGHPSRKRDRRDNEKEDQKRLLATFHPAMDFRRGGSAKFPITTDVPKKSRIGATEAGKRILYPACPLAPCTASIHPPRSTGPRMRAKGRPRAYLYPQRRARLSIALVGEVGNKTDSREPMDYSRSRTMRLRCFLNTSIHLVLLCHVEE